MIEPDKGQGLTLPANLIRKSAFWLAASLSYASFQEIEPLLITRAISRHRPWGQQVIVSVLSRDR